MSLFHCCRCSADLSDLTEWLYINQFGESLCMLCYYVIEESAPQWELSIEERISERLSRQQPKQETLNV